MDLNQFLGSSEGLAALIANLIRVGEVTSVNTEALTARVRFQDRDDIESFDLHVVTYNSHKNKRYWTPDVGENVLCLFLPTGVEAGFILGAYYPAPVNRPENSLDVDVMEYEDGTRIEYNRADHRLLVDLGATKIAVDRSSILLESNSSSVTINSGGVAVVGGSLTHNGVNVGDSHAHSGIIPGPANTGGPL